MFLNIGICLHPKPSKIDIAYVMVFYHNYTLYGYIYTALLLSQGCFKHPRDLNQDHVTYDIQTLESDYIFHFQNKRIMNSHIHWMLQCLANLPLGNKIQ